MAPAPSLVGLFIAPLNRAGIEYMTTGGLAAVVYGHPRLTLDVDLVISLAPRDIDTFTRLWPLNQFYCPPKEVEHGYFNVIHHDTAMRADVYLAGTDALQGWAERVTDAALEAGLVVWPGRGSFSSIAVTNSGRVSASASGRCRSRTVPTCAGFVPVDLGLEAFDPASFWVHRGGSRTTKSNGPSRPRASPPPRQVR